MAVSVQTNGCDRSFQPLMKPTPLVLRSLPEPKVPQRMALAFDDGEPDLDQVGSKGDGGSAGQRAVATAPRSCHARLLGLPTQSSGCGQRRDLQLADSWALRVVKNRFCVQTRRSFVATAKTPMSLPPDVLSRWSPTPFVKYA